jgi:thioredoxin reductase
MPRHADQLRFSQLIGATFQLAEEVGILTDTNVAASNTKAALLTAIDTAVELGTQHGDIAPLADSVKRAVESAFAIGDIADDSALAALTTVDGLIALTAAENTYYRAVMP